MFLKRLRLYRNNCDIRLHDADLEHTFMKEKKIDLHILFFPFLSSGIPDVALGILKMLIRVYSRDVLQPAVYQFVVGMIYFQPICTVNVRYVQ